MVFNCDYDRSCGYVTEITKTKILLLQLQMQITSLNPKIMKQSID